MAGPETYLFTQSDVEKVLTMEDTIEAVENVFRAYGEGNVQMPPKVYLTFAKGDLRCMPTYVEEVGFAAVKNVNVHPDNDELPSVMATVSLFDPATGFPLAIMDGTYLTAMRTGAAGGIAARYLARPESKVAGFIGAGRQAETQLLALLETMENLEDVLVTDLDEERAVGFAQMCANDLGLNAFVCPIEETLAGSDIVTTVTPARKPVVMREHVRPGTHLNAIGADAQGKQELESALLKDARIVIDNWEQASHSGEINVPLAEGAITRDDVYADIGELVAGKKQGRDDDEQITVFDSTGLAIQDLACAALVYRKLSGKSSKRFTTIDMLE